MPTDGKAKYHSTLPPVCVYSPEEEAQLGEDWYDYPHQVRPPYKRGPGRPPKVEPPKVEAPKLPELPKVLPKL